MYIDCAKNLSLKINTAFNINYDAFPAKMQCFKERKMSRIAIVLLFVALVTADSNRPVTIPGINPFTPQGRIVGGQVTPIEDHPWQVSLQTYGFHFCGGSIIGKNTILTAAHCTRSYPASSMTVRVGSAQKSSGGVMHQVAEIVAHKDFQINMYGMPVNDVAILRLKEPIEFGKTTQAVKLFDQNEESVEGTLSTISGWGSTQEGGSTTEVLYTVDVPIVSKKVCNEAYDIFNGIPDGQICAAFPSGGADSCQGDSGGPMVINGRQAGIVSWGNGCARKGYPGVYTEIASVRDWLVEHAGV